MAKPLEFQYIFKFPLKRLDPFNKKQNNGEPLLY